MNDFKAEPEDLRRRQMAAADRVMRSGWFVLGNEVKAFEAEWAKTCGLSHAIGVGNGMDAIEIGLRALDIGPSDEVITTPMTAFATVLAILRAGATPVLADIDADTSLMCPESVSRLISPATKAILLVHLYGQVRNMESWLRLCNDHGVHLLEDCAQSHLAAWNGVTAGGFGRFGAYSFYPTKNLGALGDGGALVTASQSLAERARSLRNYGQSERYIHPELGLNSRLDELQAAILTERLAWLQTFTERRRTIADTYQNGIDTPHVRMLAKPAQPSSHVYHLFVLLSDHRDALSQYLTASGIANLSHYPIPVHQQQPCHNLRVDPKGLDRAETHARQCLSIPCHPQMSDQDVAQVIAAVNAFRP